MKRRLVDRRGRPRFEIVGLLTGSLEIPLRCRVRDLGLRGALLECAVPLPTRSLQRLALDVEGQQMTVNVRVCHMRPVVVRGSESVYHVGVEFLSSVPSLTDAIAEGLLRNEDESDVSGG